MSTEQKNDHIARWDQDHFFHPSTHLAQFARGEIPNRIVTGGDGVYITDRDNNRLLDAFAGLYCVNVGYGRQEIAEAIASQARELSYYHSYVGHGTESSITLVRRQRNQYKVGLVLQQRAWAAGKEKDNFALAWLPWFGLDVRLFNRS